MVSAYLEWGKGIPRVPMPKGGFRDGSTRWRVTGKPKSGKQDCVVGMVEEARVWTDKEGWVHRMNGPAVEVRDGAKVWMMRGFKVWWVDDVRTKG